MRIKASRIQSLEQEIRILKEINIDMCTRLESVSDMVFDMWALTEKGKAEVDAIADQFGMNDE